MNTLVDLMEVRFPKFLKSVRFNLIENHAIDTDKGLIWLQNKISANQISPFFPVCSNATIQFIPRHPPHCVRHENSPLIFYITPVRDVPPGDFQVERLPCLFIQVSQVNRNQLKLDFLILGSSSYDTQRMAQTLLYVLSPQNKHAILTQLKSQFLNLTPIQSGRFRDDVFYTRTTAQLKLLSHEVTPEEQELPLLFFGKKKQLLLGKNIMLPTLQVLAGQVKRLSVPYYQLESQQPALIPVLILGAIEPVLEGIHFVWDRPILANPIVAMSMRRIGSTEILAPEKAAIDLLVSGTLNLVEPRTLRNRRNPILAQPLRVLNSGFIGSRHVTQITATRRFYFPLPYAVWQITAIPSRGLPAPASVRNTFPLTGGRQITVGDRDLTVFTVKSDWGHLRFQIVSVSQIKHPYSQRFNYQTCKFPPDYYQVILPEVVEDGIYQATIFEQRIDDNTEGSIPSPPGESEPTTPAIPDNVLLDENGNQLTDEQGNYLTFGGGLGETTPVIFDNVLLDENGNPLTDEQGNYLMFGEGLGKVVQQ